MRRHAANRHKENVGSISIAVHLDTMRLQLHSIELMKLLSARKQDVYTVALRYKGTHPTIWKTGAPT